MCVCVYIYAKGPYEAKYQYLINKCKKVRLNHHDDPKSFYGMLKWYGRYLSNYLRTQSWKETSNIKNFWWFDCWYD